MGTTVRLRDEDKEKLERLRARATLSSGTKMTKEDLLRLLLDDALARGEDSLIRALGPKLPLSDAQFERMKSLVEDWGVKTSSEEIDQVLYGELVRRKRNRARSYANS